jgi:CDP-diacylglycerol--serine O-phosphatidyltransferase
VPTTTPKHFSMIRGFQPADFLTIANGCCGVAAIFGAMAFVESGERWRLYAAAALIPVAAVFDLLDGRIARWRHEHSAMGRELDSLADLISFGVAPAAIGFAAGMRTPLDQMVLIYFAVCGLSRLARYNITAESLAASSGAVRYFEGTPIPTSIVPLGVLMAAFANGNLYPIRVVGMTFHAIVLLFLLSGNLMISKTIRIPKP